MAEEKIFTIDVEGNNTIKISEEVICTIIGLGAVEAEGVHSLVGNLDKDSIVKVNPAKILKAIKVERNGDNTVVIDINVAFNYGYEIPKVCAVIQDKVKSAVETMTDLKVSGINIHVVSVVMPA